MRIRARAKLNLRLVVFDRERSGYHGLETILCAVDLADELEVERAEHGIRLTVEGPDIGPAEDNLAHRAAELFFRSAGVAGGVRLRLMKRIPAGAGLGGGSSDAAATLRALNRLCGRPLAARDLLRLGADLGSDVPFFLAGAPYALAWGRGERLLPLTPPPAAPVLIVAPRGAMSTAAAYRALDRSRPGREAGPTPDVLSPSTLGSWDGIAGIARNDFEPVLFARRPELARIKTTLSDSGAIVAQLTGSGSALFGIYRDAESRDAATAALADAVPGVTPLPTATTTRGVGRD